VAVFLIKPVLTVAYAALLLPLVVIVELCGAIILNVEMIAVHLARRVVMVLVQIILAVNIFNVVAIVALLLLKNVVRGISVNLRVKNVRQLQDKFMNKKIIISISALLVIILIILLLIFGKLLKKESTLETDQSSNQKPFQVEFLNNEEKANLNISPEIEIQVLQRGPNNEPLVYKVINNETDVVTDLSNINSFRPERNQ